MIKSLYKLKLAHKHFLLIIKENSINNICELSNSELSELMELKNRQISRIISFLEKAFIIKATKVGSTKRQIRLL